jgi:hypothetical protein
MDVPTGDGVNVQGAAVSSENTVARNLLSLERGNWFDLKVNGIFERVRLAWISPRRSFYLFMAERGERAHSLHPEALEMLVRNQDLRVAEDVPLVERAVRSVMKKLESQTLQ